MNWITSIETAIEYIENNLLNRLDYEDIAARAYCSNHHFQRMFSVFAGCTLGEYIRSRRMTLAGAELKGTDIKVLDLAMKYGYENPESFTRAFTKFHGITPSAAKNESTKLIAYTRFVNYEYAIGGNIISYSVTVRNESSVENANKLFEYCGRDVYSAQKVPEGKYAVFDLPCASSCQPLLKQVTGEWLPSTGFKLTGQSAYVCTNQLFLPIEMQGGKK